MSIFYPIKYVVLMPKVFLECFLYADGLFVHVVVESNFSLQFRLMSIFFLLPPLHRNKSIGSMGLNLCAFPKNIC